MQSPVASLLFRSLRAYQVFGANTEVGKTIFTTFLCKAAKTLWKDDHVTFLKPVSTGAISDADDRHLSKFASEVSQNTLYQYDIPASPHLAAKASGKHIPSDHELISKCRDFASQCAGRGKGWLFLETAGGVHSPVPSGSTQVDAFAPLRVPAILIGDSKLGGISQTISAFESLRSRGFDVATVLMFKDDEFQNYLYLTDYFQKNYNITVNTISRPPDREDDSHLDAQSMAGYYNNKGCRAVTGEVLKHLDQLHRRRIELLQSMSTKAHEKIWYPFTQQKLVNPGNIMTIDSAHGDYFQTWNHSPVPDEESSWPSLKASFDGSASWWTQGISRASPRLTMAASYAAGRYGHVMFAGAIHQPAIALAETLLERINNPRLSRVFYSDNGSTGTEVAVKMGLRAARMRYDWGTDTKLGVLGLKGGYHGDTIGAMDCSEPCDFNEKVEWYSGKGYWFSYPTVLCSDGKWKIRVEPSMAADLGDEIIFSSLSEIFDVEGREARGEHEVYRTYISDTLKRLQGQGRQFGALIIEPIVLGAGGMNFVDPLFQRTLVNVIRESPELFGKSSHTPVSDKDWSGLPIIFDEVFTGLHRLGRFTSSSFLGISPDISVHAKLLTGGLVPLCTTMASESIFNTFSSEDKTDALLHGHSYTAHPIGCQVALESLNEMQKMDEEGRWYWAKHSEWGVHSQTTGFTNAPAEGTSTDTEGIWSIWPRQFVEKLSRRTDRVSGVWALGTVLAIHLKDEAGTGYSSNAAVGLREALARGHEHGENGPWNVHCRVLGNVLYLMTSLTTAPDSVAHITGALQQELGCEN